jgi:molybdopterin/thiamine biosynthesis adenylyltransferase
MSVDAALFIDARNLSRKLGLADPEMIKAPLPQTGPADVVRLDFSGCAQLYLFDHGHYPDLPPVVLIHWPDASQGEVVQLQWGMQTPPAARLEQALFAGILDPPGPFRALWGQNPGAPLTDDPETAAAAGWRRVLSGRLPTSSNDAERYARIDQPLVNLLRHSNVLLVGAGSVGSYIAEQLVRTGINELTVIDPDQVELANLSRTCYAAKDIGLSKVAALSRRLLEINPSCNIQGLPVSFQAVGTRELRSVFDVADLVVAVTDDHRVQTMVNRCAVFMKKPAVYVGLYRAAKGGEVVISVPETTPCFNCTVASRPRQSAPRRERVDREVDYGTGRLTGEIALGSEIQYVSAAATKVILSLIALMKGGETVSMHRLALHSLASGQSMAVFASEADFWPEFFDPVFSGTPGQLAFRSIWLTPSSDPGCPVCGSTGHLDDPFDDIRPEPSVSEIQRVMRRGGNV